MRVVAETVVLREIEDSRFLVNSRRTSKRASSKIHYALKYLRVLLCTKNYLVSNFTHKDYICDCLNRDKRYISCRVWIIVQRICVYIVTNGTARVVSQSSCEDYGFACQIIKKKWNDPLQSWTARPRKVELPSLYYKPVCLPQLFYYRWHHSSGSSSSPSVSSTK